MRKIVLVLAAGLAGVLGSASAAVRTFAIDGAFTATSIGSIGTGSVSGQFSYDDEIDLGPPGPTGVFDLIDFSFVLGTGLTVQKADDPFAQISVRRSTGEVADFAIFATGLSGFGLNGLGFVTEATSLAFFLFNSSSEIIGTGTFSISEVTANPVPIPPVGIAVGIAALALLRRRRGSAQTSRA